MPVRWRDELGPGGLVGERDGGADDAGGYSCSERFD